MESPQSPCVMHAKSVANSCFDSFGVLGVMWVVFTLCSPGLGKRRTINILSTLGFLLLFLIWNEKMVSALKNIHYFTINSLPGKGLKSCRCSRLFINIHPLPGERKQKYVPCVQSCPILQPHGLQSDRFFCPQNFPGKNTGVGCHCLL